MSPIITSLDFYSLFMPELKDDEDAGKEGNQTIWAISLQANNINQSKKKENN